MTGTTYVDLLDVLTEGRQLPAGCDRWAVRTVRPDLSSKYGFRYPWPGSWAAAPGPFVPGNTGACPSEVGDGLCAAGSWDGMASGGVPARSLLLVAFADGDVLGGALPGKIRVARLFVVDVVDGERLVREYGSGANLAGADLGGANLAGANLARGVPGRGDLSGRTWPGRTCPGRTCPGRTWPGRTWAGRTCPGRTWTVGLSARTVTR